MDLDELFGFGDDANPLMMLIWILPIILFVFYGQLIQLWVTSSKIKKSIKKLSNYSDDSKKDLVEFASDSLGAGSKAPRLEVFLDYFSIMPVDMDPAGIVDKVQHVVRSREDYTRRQLKALSPEASEMDLSKAQTLLEIASTLRTIHKVINHLFLTAKKQHNYPLILPLQMVLPMIMEQAEALRDATSAFRAGQPVGDGIGPMIVGRMMLGTEKREAAFQTVWSDTEFSGRKILLLKARGPFSTVGRMGDAVRTIAASRRLDAIIMVDAALKMEGEDSAVVSRGFGAAIGGIGTERFQIEEVASEKKIPVFAVVIKQSVKEAIGLMTKEIADSADAAQAQIHETILENTEEGSSVLIIGVGNTMGVSQ